MLATLQFRILYLPVSYIKIKIKIYSAIILTSSFFLMPFSGVGISFYLWIL
jgi:hypothetical protein